jgi:proliferating cell nuclear antigen
MDSSHVALVSFFLHESGFASYRCDRPLTMGLNIDNLSKILKCANSDDALTFSAEEEPSNLRFTFESQKGDRFSEFNLNLLQLDSE